MWSLSCEIDMAEVAKGILGKKIGMTQLFQEDGTVVPVTVVEAGPCTVVCVKGEDRYGYSSLQLGFLKKRAHRVNKPMMGHFKKFGVEPAAVLKEIRLRDVSGFKPGDTISADIFRVGEKVDVTGISKGRGFAGGMKRHGWKGGGATHGSMFHRAPGSIGASSDPSRVFKGKRLPGHMGDERVTVQNLEIVDIRGNLIFLKGAIPGARNSVVTIRSAVKGP